MLHVSDVFGGDYVWIYDEGEMAKAFERAIISAQDKGVSWFGLEGVSRGCVKHLAAEVLRRVTVYLGNVEKNRSKNEQDGPCVFAAVHEDPACEYIVLESQFRIVPGLLRQPCLLIQAGAETRGYDLRNAALGQRLTAAFAMNSELRHRVGLWQDLLLLAALQAAKGAGLRNYQVGDYRLSKRKHGDLFAWSSDGESIRGVQPAGTMTYRKLFEELVTFGIPAEKIKALR